MTAADDAGPELVESGTGRDWAQCESWTFLEVSYVCKAGFFLIDMKQATGSEQVSGSRFKVQGSRPVGLAKEHFDSALSASLSGAGRDLAQTTYRP